MNATTPLWGGHEVTAGAANRRPGPAANTGRLPETSVIFSLGLTDDREPRKGSPLMHDTRSASRFRRPAATALPITLLAALALAGAATLWGTSFVAAKVVLTEIPPMTMAFLRFLIAALVLLPLSLRGGYRPDFGGRSALLGLVGMALFFLFQNAGLRTASATEATLMLGGGLPALTVLLGMTVLRERLDRWQIGGLVCSVLGVVAVAWTMGGGNGSASLPGIALLGLAAVCGALATVLGRRAFAGPDMLAVLTGSTIYGALMLLPPVAFELSREPLTAPSAGGLALLLYLGAGCSALAFALWAYALRHLTATQNAVIGNLELPIGMVASAALLGEALTQGCLTGGALVMAGALLSVAVHCSGIWRAQMARTVAVVSRLGAEPRWRTRAGAAAA